MASRNQYITLGTAIAAVLGITYLLRQAKRGNLSLCCSKSCNQQQQQNNQYASTIGVAEVPIIDFAKFENRERNPEEYLAECRKAAQGFHDYGCLLLRDSRVEYSENETFLDMMEQYFELSDGARDARPDLAYQVGVTPEGTEHPRNHCARVAQMTQANKPVTPCPPEADPKWRFFWRIGSRPASSRFPILNAEPVIPPEFPQWTQVMNSWGSKMLNAVTRLATMAATGFDLPESTFTGMMENGAHLLAPTGSDLGKFNALNTTLAGYHYDLNFITIHGKSRFPGLYIWVRDGRKLQVRVPDGCLFVQAGKQFEYVTGGEVLAGFHEVVVAPETVKKIDERRREKKSLWRVSSTLFSHIASDQILRPLGSFANPQSDAQFPPKYCGDQVSDELKAIRLAASK